MIWDGSSQLDERRAGGEALMFLAQRPSRETIDAFLRGSQELSLSYRPIGIAGVPRIHAVDETTVAIGHGDADFERAREALIAWKPFDIGWIETFPRDAPLEGGTVVAVLVHHFGFWSLNGCRVLYRIDDANLERRFAFACGTLTNHAEAGEELFEVFVDPDNDAVMYRIRAMSRPRAALARFGHPVVRMLQARFRRHSIAAMRRATGASVPTAMTST